MSTVPSLAVSSPLAGQSVGAFRVLNRLVRQVPGEAGGWGYDAAMAIAEDLEVASFLKGQPKKLFIGGRWVDSASGKTFDTLDPATGEVLASVAEGSAEDVDRAVAAARRSFDSGVWRDLPPAERARALWRVGDMIEDRALEFAQLDSLDNGMPINDALLFFVPFAAATFRYYAGWVTKLDGATQEISLPGKYLSYTLRQPVGVVGQIIPWNLPIMMAAWKIAPALACGNSVVLKPSEETPLSALLLAELLQEAELPAGVLNVVPGRGETAGARLAAHPDVDKLAFTGSTEVGKLIARAAGRAAWTPATASNRPASPTSTARCASRARRSSGRWSPPSPSVTRTTWSRRRTARSTDWWPVSGRRT